MSPRTASPARFATFALLAAAGSAALTPALAVAQEAKLAVHASPTVLYAGQSAGVDVHAVLPPNAYAFASTQFNMHATQPAWTFATAGVLAGNNVMNILASQQHMPHAGIVANPANPYHVWRGVLTPISNAPALIEISAAPQALSIYPSKLTSSSIPCDVKGASDYVLVNPLRVGHWLAAPGHLTSIEVIDNAAIDARLTSGADPDDPIFLAMLFPAIQSGRGSTIRMEVDGMPTKFRAAAQVDIPGSNLPIEQHAVNFTRIDFNNGPSVMGLSADSPADALPTFRAFIGGVRVAAGDLSADGRDASPALVVDSLPQTSTVKVGPGTLVLSNSNQAEVVWTLAYDEPVFATARARDGSLRQIVLDTIEVRTKVREPAPQPRHATNIKQLAIAVHTYQATGADRMIVTPTQP